MKQIQKSKRHRAPAGGWQEPMAASPRDPDIVRAHRIARGDRRSRNGRVRSGRHNLSAPAPGR